jgi:hypothetical protein
MLRYGNRSLRRAFGLLLSVGGIIMDYEQVLRATYKGDFSTVPERLLVLDPGHETGWCMFINGRLTGYGQVMTIISDNTKGAKSGALVIDWKELEDLFNEQLPTHIVCENYRIYAHKLERHSFSQVETLRLIGGIDMMSHVGWMERETPGEGWDDKLWQGDPCELQVYHQPVPITYQMAVEAKGFITDDRLKKWDMWKTGMKHSRDAIRHGLYFLIITNRPKGDK